MTKIASFGRLVIASLIAATALLTAPIAAQAQSVRGEVLIILGDDQDSTPNDPNDNRDAVLRGIAALSRPPFDGFVEMHVLNRPSITVEVGRPTEVNLPNGRRLRILLQRQLPNGRYMIQVSINRPDQNDYLPLLTVVAAPGDPFFVAGQSHEGGTLIIGVRVGSAST